MSWFILYLANPALNLLFGIPNEFSSNVCRLCSVTLWPTRVSQLWKGPIWGSENQSLQEAPISLSWAHSPYSIFSPSMSSAQVKYRSQCMHGVVIFCGRCLQCFRNSINRLWGLFGSQKIGISPFFSFVLCCSDLHFMPWSFNRLLTHLNMCTR